MQHDSVDIYIDETGNFHGNNNNEFKCLGGILAFDWSTDKEQDVTNNIMIGSWSKQITYPKDFHFSETYGARRVQLCEIFAGALGDLKVHSFRISHKHDRYQSRNDYIYLADEGFLDNRYLEMFTTIIEHLLFVSPFLTDNLKPEAKIKLHVASRKLPIENLNMTREELEAMGFNSMRNTDLLFGFLEPRVLYYLLKSLIQKWNPDCRWKFELSGESLNYNNPNRAYNNSLFYLADIYMGASRPIGNTANSLSKYFGCDKLFDELIVMQYGDLSHQLGKLQYCLTKTLSEAIAILGSICVQHTNFTKYQHEILDFVISNLRQRLITEPHQLRSCISTILSDCRNSLYTRQGYTLLVGFEKLCKIEELENPHYIAQLLTAKLCYYNHTGQINRANDLWNDVLEIEQRVLETGPEGHRLMLNLRVLRGVALTDQFLLKDAIEHFKGCPLLEDNTVADIINTADLSGQSLRHEIGTILGSLGQAYAFNKDYEKALKCFDKAYDYFIDENDKTRQLIYKGYVACDLKDPDIWSEIDKFIPKQTELTLRSNRFWLALYLRYLWDFEVNKSDFLMNTFDELSNLSQNEKIFHPMGLIFQLLALLIRRDTNEENYSKAKCAYMLAEESMSNGGPVLTLLKQFLKLRWSYYSAEEINWHYECEQIIVSISRNFRALNENREHRMIQILREIYDNGSNLDDKKAELLSQIQFNWF